MIWEMEKMSYIARLWGYQKKNLCWKCIHTKWEMPRANGFISLSGEDISRAGVQKKPDKFRLEMRRAILMLTIITHCNQLQSEMVGSPSPDALQRYGWLSVAHYYTEDCLAIVGEIRETCIGQDVSDPFWYSKHQINLWGYAKNWWWMWSWDKHLLLKICISQLPCPSHSKPN